MQTTAWSHSRAATLTHIQGLITLACGPTVLPYRKALAGSLLTHSTSPQHFPRPDVGRVVVMSSTACTGHQNRLAQVCKHAVRVIDRLPVCCCCCSCSGDYLNANNKEDQVLVRI